MTEILIPIGGHIFSASALQTYADDAAREIVPGHTNILKAGVDAEGVKVVLVMTAKQGTVKIQTAFAHDWTGNTSFGAGGSVSF